MIFSFLFFSVSLCLCGSIPAAEPTRLTRKSIYDANVYDLLKAYSQQRQRTATRTLQMRQRTVWSLGEARAELERLLGITCDWAPLDQLIAEFLVEPELRRTALASSFTATLEMTREGSCLRRC